MIGSHNSWTFGKTKWYVPAFVARCQCVNIPKQYKLGARVFDLRLRWEDHQFKTSHGAVIFNTNFLTDLLFLSRQALVNQEKIYVRVILEYNNEPFNRGEIEHQFIQLLNGLLEYYPYLTFFGGRWKYSWEQIYKFKENEPVLVDKYSSTTSLFKSDSKLLRIIDDWWPWLYARLKNKKNYKVWKEQGEKDCLFIDFVNMIL